ncbi:MAG TPA: YeeE/YedE thiosulfate transporter family protein [Polyangia bacterium]|nr:YeeE/YedE thiosulfate transporter family protein [Polyangia bacterium]
MTLISEVCPWPLAGLLVGLIAVGLQWADNLPLGATGAAAGFLGWSERPWRRPGWRALFFVGTVAGGFLYAHLTGRFALSWSLPKVISAPAGGAGLSPLALAVAGTFIGFGARWAGGCTSGHGICGVGRLQRGSLLATLTFVLTAAIVAELVWRVQGR